MHWVELRFSMSAQLPLVWRAYGLWCTWILVPREPGTPQVQQILFMAIVLVLSALDFVLIYTSGERMVVIAVIIV